MRTCDLVNLYAAAIHQRELTCVDALSEFYIGL